MFGGTAPTSTPSTGGLFGSAAKPAAPSAPSTGGGLFGNAGSSTTPASKPSLSIFGGAPSTAAKPSLLTTTPATTTAQTGPTPSVQQAVKIELHNLAPYHKFHELTDALRGEVEAAEKYILSEIQKSEALAAAFPEHREMIQSVSGDAELMERRLLTTNSFLESDTAALQSLIKHQKLDDQHASLSVRTLDLLRLPHAARMLQAQYATTNPGQPNAAATTSAMGQSTFQIPGVAGTSGAGAVGGGMIPAGGGATPTASAFAPLPTSSSTTTNELEITSNAGMIGYFTRHGAEMEARLKQFLESVAEVEASLRSVEVQAAMKIAGGDLSMGGALGGVGGGAAQDRKGDARKLNAVLREFYDALNDVSSRVVEVKEGLRELKAMTSARGGRR
ncbi:hypothetical protein BDZ91DRAFT_179010 [Kalaharituber pfeilii]|nr:hypothetical protein BDZ91DRAFT_179010 [Kalaharituber pfeilii]